MMMRCHIHGKKNIKGPNGWENDDHAPWYDPEGHYGKEIPGALSNGYTEEEVLDYFKKIEGYSSYCFNKSHAVSYSILSFIGAFLKLYHPVEYMAANLSVFGDNPDKLSSLMNSTEKMGIKVKVPNINISGIDFTPEGNSILYGLSAIKGVGEKAYPDLLANAPYVSLEDCIKRIPKKAFNKSVAEALIKAGAFDWLNENRLTLLNELHELRKDKVLNEATGKKEIVKYEDSLYNELSCMNFEKEALGVYVTYKPWWETIPENQYLSFDAEVIGITEKTDKKGGLMAKISLRAHNCVINAVCFSSKYGRINDLFQKNYYLTVEGKKGEANKWNPKGDFIINDAKVISD